MRTWIVNQLFQVFSGLCQREDRSRPIRCANMKRQAKSPLKSLNGKLNWPCDEKKLVQQRLNEAEADVEVKHWEKRNYDIALFLRLIRSLNPNDYSYNRRINGLIRLKEIR